MATQRTLIDHVPDLDLDHVVRHLVVPRNVRDLHLGRRRVLLRERPALEASKQRRLADAAIAANQNAHCATAGADDKQRGRNGRINMNM